MEMPKNCDKCLYSSWSNFYQIYVCNAIRKNEPVLFDKKQVKSTDTVRSGRADNCPLVPVPPHGRLIDADALEDALWAQRRQYQIFDDTQTADKIMHGLYRAEQIIKETPTIIPAEEEE